jgi:hypothetical protein
VGIEATLKTTLSSLVGGRVYPSTLPDNPTFPLIVYQQVGGQVVEYLEGTIGDKDNARIQIVVWSKTQLEASSIARSIRTTLVGSLSATTLAAPVSLYEEELKLYGSRTDYSLWYVP